MPKGTTMWFCTKCSARYDHGDAPRPVEVAHKCLSNRGRLTEFVNATRKVGKFYELPSRGRRAASQVEA